MKFEISKMRPLVDAMQPSERLKSANECRRSIRLTTDMMIHDALKLNRLPDLVTWSVRVMQTTAEILIQQDIDPQAPDFVAASIELIEQARNAMDMGLKLDDKVRVTNGAVMIEVICRGIHAALGLDYEALFAAAVDGREVTYKAAHPELHDTPASADACLFRSFDGPELPAPPELGGALSQNAPHTDAP